MIVHWKAPYSPLLSSDPRWQALSLARLPPPKVAIEPCAASVRLCIKPKLQTSAFWEDFMHIINRRAALTGAAALAAASSTKAGAQAAWPARPITIVNPFPAGGGTDAFARPLAAQLDSQLGVRFLVDNRGGAGGTLGATAASKMAPDGYTFFMGAAHHSIAPALYPKLDYDIEKDFVPIGIVSSPPQVVVVNPARIKARTLAELIAEAKAKPGALNYGSAGNGTTHHLAGELFQMLTGTKMAHIPYRGSGPAMQDLVGGQIDLMFDGLGSSAQQIASGTINALAVASPVRSSSFPNVPTAAEAGVAGFEVATWYALWAIKGTPADIIERMTAELLKAFNTPLIQEAWKRNGSEVVKLTGAPFGAFVSAEIARWGKVVNDSGVRL
jgi:tripartite-type tricarboxylate transporter receptor subunit TctC